MTPSNVVTQVPDLLSSTLVYGHFTSIHPGHIRYLLHAKELGEPLVIALIGDQDDNFQFSQADRCQSLQLLNIADYILLLPGRAFDNIITSLKPLHLVLGTEHKSTSDRYILDAVNEAHSIGCKTQYHAGDSHYVNTSLLSKDQHSIKDIRIQQFNEACRRQGILHDRISECLTTWPDLSIAVIGDTIIDQYSACEPLGLSAEAPVVVVKELEQRNYIGGASIVAAHLRSLGPRVHYLSVVGNDENSNILRDELDSLGISSHLYIDHTRPTTFKKRYVVGSQKLFRVSRLDDSYLSESAETHIIQSLTNIAPTINALILSDFVYGVLTPSIKKHCINLSQEYGFELYGDVQCSSQVGSFLGLKGFTLLTPNEREARLSLQDKDSGIERIANQILHTTTPRYLCMKLSQDGFIAYDASNSTNIIKQAFPALNPNPVDVAGAGDSMLAAYAASISSGLNFMEASAVASCMASIAVDRMGNIPIAASLLKSSLADLFDTNPSAR